jgi:hypothetical protein
MVAVIATLSRPLPSKNSATDQGPTSPGQLLWCNTTEAGVEETIDESEGNPALGCERCGECI